MSKIKLAPAKKSAFDVDLAPEDLQALVTNLSSEIEGALQARSEIIGTQTGTGGGLLDYWWALYEAGNTKITRNGPWPDSADLVSYLGTEKVDALQARAMRTVFVDPICIVEGWGAAADQAPIVEAFHQWKAEEENLAGWVGKAWLSGFVEGTGVLEVVEQAELTRTKSQKRIKLQLHPETGQPILGEDNQPLLATDAQGLHLEASPDESHAVALIDETQRSAGGPQYRVLSLRDFVILPGHARDKSEVYGYAKRLFKRLPEIRQGVQEQLYDAAEAEKIAGTSDRLPSEEQARMGQAIQSQDIDDTVEKELWEVLLKRDLDGDGIEEWYVITLSIIDRACLRVRHDDLKLPRCLLFIPFPHPFSVYGFSLIGHKLFTTIEEHTAVRNMRADRSAMKTNMPIGLMTGAKWDPNTQPWGPGQTIPMNDPNEIHVFDIPDVPQSMQVWEEGILSAAERIAGVNDIALGVQNSADRTLGENQMAFAQSAVRMDLVIRNFQETLGDLYEVRHALYKRQYATKGATLPASVTSMLSAQGVQVPETGVDATVLEGEFRFVPRGSTDTADPSVQRNDFNGLMGAAGNLAKTNPLFAQAMFGSPEAVKAWIQQLCHVYRWPDQQAFLKALQAAVQAAQAQAQQQAQQPPAPPPGPPGAVPGGPPGAPPMNPLQALLQRGPQGLGQPPTATAGPLLLNAQPGTTQLPVSGAEGA